MSIIEVGESVNKLIFGDKILYTHNAVAPVSVTRVSVCNESSDYYLIVCRVYVATYLSYCT